ncbi:lipocalin family protein [Saprospiraceae bacterium]|nr:lipocalin family protein [Saprospiraceae bacterium]
MKLTITCILLLFLFSCNNGMDKVMLYGEWKTVEWKEIQTGKSIQQKMDFDFSEDGRYSVDYGSEKEIGDWWVRGNFLHTREDNQAEKKVLVSEIDSSRLVLEMNRGGVLEQVILKAQ